LNNRKDDVFSVLKKQFVSICKENLKIFGISKVKTLIDFVTTEQDVKRGNNRLPLRLARLHEENILPEEDNHRYKYSSSMYYYKNENEEDE
jgi:spermidine/putrescine-binding protein